MRCRKRGFLRDHEYRRWTIGTLRLCPDDTDDTWTYFQTYLPKH